MGEHTPDVFEPAPDFSVKTANEDIFQLSRALSEEKNMLLVFYRGHW